MSLTPSASGSPFSENCSSISAFFTLFQARLPMISRSYPCTCCLRYTSCQLDCSDGGRRINLYIGRFIGRLALYLCWLYQYQIPSRSGGDNRGFAGDRKSTRLNTSH